MKPVTHNIISYLLYPASRVHHLGPAIQYEAYPEYPRTPAL